MIRDLTWLGLTWDEGESGHAHFTGLSAVLLGVTGLFAVQGVIAVMMANVS